MLEDTLRSRRESIREVFRGCPRHDLVALVERVDEEAITRLLPADWEAIVGTFGHDAVPAAISWRQFAACRFAGLIASTPEQYDRIDRRTSTAADLAIASALHAEALSRLGDDEGALALLADAARLSTDDRATAYRLFAEDRILSWRGEFGNALRVARDGLVFALRAEDRVAEALLRTGIVWDLRGAGRFSDAINEAERALDLCEAVGSLSARAFVRSGRGVCLMAIGRLDEALKELTAAVDDWVEVGSPQAAQGWSLVGEIQRDRGNIALAEMALRRSLDLASQTDVDRRMVGIVKADLAGVIASHNPAEARDLLREALDSGPHFNELKVRISAGWALTELGDREHAHQIATEVLGELNRRQSDPTTLASALQLKALAGPADEALPAIREAGSLWQETGYVVHARINAAVASALSGDRLGYDLALDALRRLGVHDDIRRAAGPLRLVGTAERAPRVRIQMLGPFSVELNGKPVTSWPSRKARDLLKMLVDAGEPGMRRDAATEHLWPDADSTRNKLSVALSQLRAVLDPEHALPNDAYLRADRDRIGLDFSQLSVDVADFRAAAQRALRLALSDDAGATDALMAAATLHGGEYLSGDAYADWAVAGREEVERLGTDVLRTLAMRLAANAPEAALPWLTRVVADDPYDEPAQCTLIALLVREGRHGEARRNYRAYADRMAEIGVSAAAWADVTEHMPV